MNGRAVFATALMVLACLAAFVVLVAAGIGVVVGMAVG